MYPSPSIPALCLDGENRSPLQRSAAVSDSNPSECNFTTMKLRHYFELVLVVSDNRRRSNDKKGQDEWMHNKDGNNNNDHCTNGYFLSIAIGIGSIAAKIIGWLLQRILFSSHPKLNAPSSFFL